MENIGGSKSFLYSHKLYSIQQQINKSGFRKKKSLSFGIFTTGFLPAGEVSCPLVPVVYITNIDGNHFFTIIFDPAKGTIYIVGKHYNQSSRILQQNDWQSWQGNHIWDTVCKFMGWDHTEIGPIQLYFIDWKQNGYDCGPIACQVALHIIENGVDSDMSSFWSEKKFPCCHLLRIKIAETAHGLVCESKK